MLISSIFISKKFGKIKIRQMQLFYCRLISSTLYIGTLKENLKWIDVRVLWVILLCFNNRSVLDSTMSSLLVRSWMEVFSNSSIRLKTGCPCCLSEDDPFLYSPSNSLNRDSWRRLVTPVRDSPMSEGSLVPTRPSLLLI